MGVREGAERRVRLRREAGVRRSGPGPERTVNGREVPGRRREAKPLGTEAWGGDAAASEPRGGQLSRPLLTDRTGCSPGLSPLGRSFSGGRSPPRRRHRAAAPGLPERPPSASRARGGPRETARFSGACRRDASGGPAPQCSGCRLIF